MHAARVLLTLFLCAGGALNLGWMVRRRGSPAEMRGCLLACAACLLFSAALWVRGTAAYVAAGLGLGCAAIWFLHIYRQSLHNTTM